ncbi:hypothetical protein TNCV_303751 [Trichonephila clavipes]|nr:hypothetical protein TNCV_303751 [Trichonephila clavipes]
MPDRTYSHLRIVRMPSPVQYNCDAHDTIANGQYGAVWSMGHTQQTVYAWLTEEDLSEAQLLKIPDCSRLNSQNKYQFFHFLEKYFKVLVDSNSSLEKCQIEQNKA